MVRQGRGDHEIWFSPISGKHFPVDGNIKSRHTANAVLAQRSRAARAASQRRDSPAPARSSPVTRETCPRPPARTPWTPMRFFNTSGPIIAEQNYHVPPLSRFDNGQLDRLIGQWRYFVLHAPRRTGKTTALAALRDRLNESGRYRCVYVNVEPAQTAREDVAAAMQAILSELGDQAIYSLGDQTVDDMWPDILALRGARSGLPARLWPGGRRPTRPSRSCWATRRCATSLVSWSSPCGTTSGSTGRFGRQAGEGDADGAGAGGGVVGGVGGVRQ